MSTRFDRRQSAPSRHLNLTGTAITYGILRWAISTMPDEELRDLEEDLEFYDQTGVVGIHVSRMLGLLRQNIPNTCNAELAA